MTDFQIRNEHPNFRFRAVSPAGVAFLNECVAGGCAQRDADTYVAAHKSAHFMMQTATFRGLDFSESGQPFAAYLTHP